MTVFVVQEPMKTVSQKDVDQGYHDVDMIGKRVPLFNLRPAMRYGDIKVLLKHKNLGLTYQPIVEDLKKALRQFSDDDYILSTGDPAAIGVAVAIAAMYNSGRVKILVWDKRFHEYNEAAVDLQAA